jgi:hypothetical protein
MGFYRLIGRVRAQIHSLGCSLLLMLVCGMLDASYALLVVFTRDVQLHII